MRKGMMLGAAGLGVALLAGCGGSSSNSVAVTRVLVGFVYVTKNDGGTYSGPTAFILPHNNLTVLTPTTGSNIPLDKPTAGTIQLSVAGTLTKDSTATLNFDLSSSNEIICTAGGAANAAVTVTVTSPIYDGSVVKTLSVPTISLGTATGTVLGIQSPNTPTYTPGAPDSIIVRLNTTVGSAGAAYTGPELSPDQMMTSNGTGATGLSLGSGFEAGQVYTVSPAVLDKNGIAVTGASCTVTSSDNTRVLPNAGPPITLTAVAGQTTATGITITTSVTGYTLVSSTFQGPYNPGTASYVTVAPSTQTLLWATTGAPATAALLVTVANEVGCPLPGASVAMSSTKETTPGTSNTWVSAGGTVFTTYTGTTGAGGTLATSVQAPASVGAQAAGNTALGKGTITATCGSATGTAYVTLYRPLGSLTATGPARLDVGVSSTASGAQSYQLTGALDVDGNTATTPSVTWTVSNVAGPASIGNTGDTSAPTAADASINASTGVVAPGSTAGKIQVKVASSTDATVYATITTDIYGPPTKMLFSPDTATPSDGYTAAQGYALPISFTVIDSYGHTVPFTELTSPLATTYSISSSAAGSIAAGATAESFTLTFGNTTGTITIGTGAFTWHGAEGGSATLGAITRTINVVGS